MKATHDRRGGWRRLRALSLAMMMGSVGNGPGPVHAAESPSAPPAKATDARQVEVEVTLVEVALSPGQTNGLAVLGLDRPNLTPLDLRLALNRAEQQEGVQVLSGPKITTLSDRPATISMRGFATASDAVANVPVGTASRTTGATSEPVSNVDLTVLAHVDNTEAIQVNWQINVDTLVARQVVGGVAQSFMGRREIAGKLNGKSGGVFVQGGLETSAQRAAKSPRLPEGGLRPTNVPDLTTNQNDPTKELIVIVVPTLINSGGSVVQTASL